MRLDEPAAVADPIADARGAIRDGQDFARRVMARDFAQRYQDLSDARRRRESARAQVKRLEQAEADLVARVKPWTFKLRGQLTTLRGALSLARQVVDALDADLVAIEAQLQTLCRHVAVSAAAERLRPN